MSAPRFVKRPAIRQADKGKTLFFECEVHASPQPEIQWFRGETLLTADQRMELSCTPIGSDNFSVVLQITNIDQADGGIYRVKAINKSGEAAASLNLNFSKSRVN